MPQPSVRTGFRNDRSGGVGPVILVSFYRCPAGPAALRARCFAANVPIIVMARRQDERTDCHNPVCALGFAMTEVAALVSLYWSRFILLYFRTGKTARICPPIWYRRSFPSDDILFSSGQSFPASIFVVSSTAHRLEPLPCGMSLMSRMSERFVAFF